MEKLRLTYPLAFALVAALVAIVSFQVFPSSNSIVGYLDPGDLRQRGVAAIVLAIMYLYSGEYLLDELVHRDRTTSRDLSVPRVLSVVGAAALALGVAAVYVQGSAITPPTMAVVVFIAILLATAVLEEILFRGFFFEGFARTLAGQGSARAIIGAALASSFLFGVLHVSSDFGSLFRTTAYIQAAVKAAEGMLFGLIMCALYVKTKGVWVPVSAHFAFNVVSETPIYLATGVQKFSYITGSPADIVVLALGTAILLPAAKWAWDYLS